MFKIFLNFINMPMQLNNSWLPYLEDEFKKDYFKDIKVFLKKEVTDLKSIYPHPNDIFNALNTTDFDNLKVVILWQDPYHGVNQAHWLSFSVQDWVNPPPSLKNIYKEIETDLWVKKDFKNWNLTSWAESWVLLLNAFLTVEASKPASHSKIWWWNFTDKVIETISKEKEWVVFLLWWNFAKQKKSLIDISKHHILEAPHPSPFSAYTGFYWCKHFSKTNDILKNQWKKEINW